MKECVERLNLTLITGNINDRLYESLYLVINGNNGNTNGMGHHTHSFVKIRNHEYLCISTLILIILTNIAIFASGSGTNAQKIVEYFRQHPTINISVICCNNASAGVIRRAEKLNIPCILFDRAQYRNGQLLTQLQEKNINGIVLAGFLWLIPKEFVEAYPQEIINLHPALLPKFGGKGMYGHHVHEAVIAAHETQSGITIHYVNEHYDEGNIIFQAAYAITPLDTPGTIAAKGQVLEHTHFPRVIEQVFGR